MTLPEPSQETPNKIPLGDEAVSSGYATSLHFWMLVAIYAGYLVATFFKLTAFPPYFFCDEAIAGVDAWSMWQTGRDFRGIPWPIFFHGLGEYALSLSVYLQIPFVALLGLDESAVRARAAVMSVLALASVSFLFVKAKGVRNLWLVPLLLVSSTFWYLHSRAGFEYMDATACYFAAIAAFLLACSSKKFRWVLISGALFGASFYAYTPARGWAISLLAALAALTFFDRRLSWKVLIQMTAICTLVLIPLFWIQYKHPEITMQRFQAIRGERIYTLPFQTVVFNTISNYAYVLNPHYWFFRTENLHPRHSLPGFSLIPSWLVPLWCIGVANILWGWRNLHNRILAACILTAPLTASLFEISTARCFPVGVCYIILCAFGADVVLRKLPRLFAPLAALAACVYAGWFVHYTQTQALYSYPFYGMYGIQYGARQLYGWVKEKAKTEPDIRIINATFNSGDAFLLFFLSPEERRRVKIIEPLRICQGRDEWSDSTLFVFPAEWFESNPPDTCPPFEKEIIEVIRDPKGKPLLEAVRLKHSQAVNDWFIKIKNERLALKVDNLVVNGMPITFEHTKIAWGTIAGFFDGDSGTRARTDDINPGIFSVRFAETAVDEVGVRLDNTRTAVVRVEVLQKREWVQIAEQNYSRDRGDSSLLLFKNPFGSIEGARFTVRLTDGGEQASVHLADIFIKRVAQ
jgi:hypothetical protein